MEDLSQDAWTTSSPARIVAMEKHPDADKLQVCQVDVGGEEPVQIVTGAQNVFDGALCPLLPSTIPTSRTAPTSSGASSAASPSNGMMCSGEELCLKEGDYPGAEVHGILILQGDAPSPAPICGQLLDLNDVIIDFSILSNRPDCNSRPRHRPGGCSCRSASPFHRPRAPLHHRRAAMSTIRLTVTGGGLRPLPAVYRPGGQKSADRPVARLDEANASSSAGMRTHQQHR